MQYIKSIEYFTIDENMTTTANSSFSLIKTKKLCAKFLFSKQHLNSKIVPNKKRRI